METHVRNQAQGSSFLTAATYSVQVVAILPFLFGPATKDDRRGCLVITSVHGGNSFLLRNRLQSCQILELNDFEMMANKGAPRSLVLM